MERPGSRAFLVFLSENCYCVLVKKRVARVWFSGRILPCHGRDRSSILLTRTRAKSTRGEMDITAVFGTVIPGSSPGGCTKGERSETLGTRRKQTALLPSGRESRSHIDRREMARRGRDLLRSKRVVTEPAGAGG